MSFFFGGVFVFLHVLFGLGDIDMAEKLTHGSLQFHLIGEFDRWKLNFPAVFVSCLGANSSACSLIKIENVENTE